MVVIGVGCTLHTWARAQVKFLKGVDFFNRFNSVASFSNKVNKISNMTLWFLHKLTLKEPWLINITLQIIYLFIWSLKIALGFTKINDKNLPVY